MSVTMDNLTQRVAAIKSQLGVLAYEKIGLLERLNQVERQIALLDAQGTALETTRADVQTDEVVRSAQATATREGETHA